MRSVLPALLLMLLTLPCAHLSRSLSVSDLLRPYSLLPPEREALLEALPAEVVQHLLEQKGLLDSTPKSGIPAGVECEEYNWCDGAGVCSTVCARGSVKQSDWQAWAMQYQMNLTRKQPLCYSQLLATHNSAITLADGYGNRDGLYSAYLRWLKTFGATSDLHTNNQWLSLTDQLNLGVRVLELDVHFVAGELRIAHCGGFHSPQLDRIVALINAVAKVLGRPELTWDAETVGCSPSLSSIATKDQRLFADALEEIAIWMRQPANSQELLVLFFDDQPDLGRWNKVRDMLDQLTKYFPLESILTPPEARAMLLTSGAAPDAIGEELAPSIEQLVQSGKRILLLSGTDYQEEMDSLIFSGRTFSSLCPYDEAWMHSFTFNASSANSGRTVSKDSLAPAHGWAVASLTDPGDPEADPEPDPHPEPQLGPDMCFLSQGRHGQAAPERVPLFQGRLVRMPACELHYGPLDCNFRMGKQNEGLVLNESAMAQVTACGLNCPAPDLLTTVRAAAHIWGWAPNHPPVAALSAPTLDQAQAPRQASRGPLQDAGCAFADALDGRWRIGPCAAPTDERAVLAACRSTDPASWPQQRRRRQRLQLPVSQTLWLLAPMNSCLPWAGANDGCCPPGFTPDIPYTAVENLLLMQAMRAEGATRALLPLVPPLFTPQGWSPGALAQQPKTSHAEPVA